ncbi:MAG: hypothetical protein KDD40_10940 [Bdellovibrionales bacterium]|nr:hypothetical protein [Bdellovibrionales bacterium]
MLLSMLTGEWLVDPLMFGGFSLQPKIWLLVLLETMLALTPVLMIGWWILKPFSDSPKATFIILSAFTWITLGLILVFYYNAAYLNNTLVDSIKLNTKVWLFGWILPCFISWWFITKYSLTQQK